MIQILIGRESPNNRLQLVVGTKATTCGAIGSVPKDVSRSHCLLTVDDNSQTMKLTNQKSNNVTWVNDMAIESCIVTTKDRVELGSSHYSLDWAAVIALLDATKKSTPQELDIRPLENVWKKYKKDSDALQYSQMMTNVLRGGLPILTIGGVAAGYIMNKGGSRMATGPMKYLYVAALLLMVVCFVKSFFDARRIPKKRDELNKKMLRDYACPHCHYFFGYQPYDVIKANLDTCPKCRNKFKK